MELISTLKNAPADSVLALKYQGNARKVIPLIFGETHGGRLSLLCYKLGETEDEPEMVLRLYHVSKISDLRVTNEIKEVNRKLDYYLTKHFANPIRKY